MRTYFLKLIEARRMRPVLVAVSEIVEVRGVVGGAAVYLRGMPPLEVLESVETIEKWLRAIAWSHADATGTNEPAPQAAAQAAVAAPRP